MTEINNLANINSIAPSVRSSPAVSGASVVPVSEVQTSLASVNNATQTLSVGPPADSLTPQAALVIQETETTASEDQNRQPTGVAVQADEEVAAEDETSSEESGTSADPTELTSQEQAQVRQLQQIDAEVRRHEQAHAAAGGGATGAPTYEYTRGPDGKQYAVAGEVSISVPTGGGDPASRIEDLRQVQKAALAPTNPSPQDLKVAATAVQGIAAAEAELQQERLEEIQESREKLDEVTGEITLGGDPTENRAGNNAEENSADTADAGASDITAAQAAQAFQAAANLSSNNNPGPSVNSGAVPEIQSTSIIV